MNPDEVNPVNPDADALRAAADTAEAAALHAVADIDARALCAAAERSPERPLEPFVHPRAHAMADPAHHATRWNRSWFFRWFEKRRRTTSRGGESEVISVA